MAAFPLVRLLPTLLLLGLLGQLLEVEADAVADAASSQVNFLGSPSTLATLISLIPRTKWKLTNFQHMHYVYSDPKFL